MPLVAVPLLFALAVGLNYAADALLFAPWDHGLLGRPTLTGNWTGTLRTHSGVPYALYLHLNRSPAALSGRLAPDLDGSVSWCARALPSTTSPVSGTADHSAAHVRLDMHEPARPHLGLQPATFQGAWHGSTLALHVLFTWYNGHAFVFAQSLPDEFDAVPLTLHKGGYGAYQAACARI